MWPYERCSNGSSVDWYATRADRILADLARAITAMLDTPPVHSS
jgi:hypothetical protein